MAVHNVYRSLGRNISCHPSFVCQMFAVFKGAFLFTTHGSLQRAKEIHLWHCCGMREAWSLRQIASYRTSPASCKAFRIPLAFILTSNINSCESWRDTRRQQSGSEGNVGKVQGPDGALTNMTVEPLRLILHGLNSWTPDWMELNSTYCKAVDFIATYGPTHFCFPSVNSSRNTWVQWSRRPWTRQATDSTPVIGSTCLISTAQKTSLALSSIPQISNPCKLQAGTGVQWNCHARLPLHICYGECAQQREQYKIILLTGLVTGLDKGKVFRNSAQSSPLTCLHTIRCCRE